MTQHELRQKLATVLADLCLIQHMLEHAVRAGVPPDMRYVVQLDATKKLVRSILLKLDDREPTTLEESV